MLSQTLTGTLLRETGNVRQEDLAAIKSLPNPPLISLQAGEIYVRKCRLASDRVDSRFGCFRTEDLPELLEMVQGAPVLIGHDRRTLGVARFFGGTLEKRGEATWIIPSFYWPKAHSKADDLRIMIDSGVYNEASIAFQYRQPTCSICGKDLRSCAHWPGRDYDGKTCIYWYDGVEKVLEGSLVFRGAAAGTGFELAYPSSEGQEKKGEQIHQLTLKFRGRKYLASLQPIAGSR